MGIFFHNLHMVTQVALWEDPGILQHALLHRLKIGYLGLCCLKSIWETFGNYNKQKTAKSHNMFTDKTSLILKYRTLDTCYVGQIWTLLSYPFGRRYSQAVLFSVEATDSADLSDEIDVFFILRLLTLASLVFSKEVKETAGENKVPA